MNQKTTTETNRETTTDITFQKTICPADRTVRTQEIEEMSPSWELVAECLWNMFEDEDEFVVLTTADARSGVRFVQAAQIKDGITVQLGIEEGTNTRLVEKTCSEIECGDIFRDFYHTSHVKDVEKYHPVEFYK